MKLTRDILRELISEQIKKRTVRLPTETVEGDSHEWQRFPLMDIERESYWRNWDKFEEHEIEEIMEQVKTMRMHFNSAMMSETAHGRKLRAIFDILKFYCNEGFD